jgi:voltage-gated potassium channel
MQGHTVVCGYGRMGEIICRQLKEQGVQFVVIEKKLQLINFLKNTDYFYFEGDAANDDNLIRAGIKNAKNLISVIDSDADGLYITLAGRSFNPDLHIIARANETNAKNRMVRAGANRVVLPFVMSGMKVAESVINPEVEDFFSLPDSNGESNDFMRIADLNVTAETGLVGKSLKEIGPNLEGIIVIGIRKEDKSFLFKPDSSYIFQLGDILVTMGEGETHHKLHDSFKAA